MPYDASLDKNIFSETTEWEMTKITVGVFSYNDGEKKLQLTRENNVGDEWRYAKLGRMNKQEAEAVIPLMKKALENM